MITFRKATIEDARMVLDWRNDAESLEGSVTNRGRKLPWSAHERWFKNTLNMPRKERWLLIAERDEEPVGLIRFDYEDDGLQDITWIVAPPCRGQGVGEEMVLCALSLVDTDIIAKINSDNVSSKKIAENSGFVLSKTKGGIDHWIRKQTT